MKYSELDLQIEDIMWFGIDKNGYIFVCTTAGYANVPKFICDSREENEYLCNFFMNELSESTDDILNVEYDDNELINDGISLARKGIFCFDAVVDDRLHDREYMKIVSPIDPLTYNKLPNYIQDILYKHKADIDITKNKYLHFNHGY